MLKASVPAARRLSVARAMDRAGEKGTIVDEKDQKDLSGDEVVFKPFKEVSCGCKTAADFELHITVTWILKFFRCFMALSMYMQLHLL